MGGNLFKVGRVSSETYFDIVSTLRPVLDRHFGDRYRIPVAYREKKDYGDVDIILDAAVVQNQPDWFESLCSDLGVVETHRVRNVYSMLYRNFQSDVFLVGTNKLETCYHFMSYNILGNLIGRLYHKFNLKYGEDGLHYVLRGYDNHNIQEVFISRDMEKMLSFVDLSYERWKQGFNNVEEIFEYVIASKYFCSDSYDLEFFNVRKRATERPDFNKFLDYLHERNIVKNYPFDKNKEIYIEQIDEFFKCDIRGKYDKYQERQKVLMEISKKFNGRIVMELTNLTGKQLGDFLTQYKEFYGEDFEPYILKSTPEEIKENIQLLYQNTL